ncbi:MAG: crossover junction endodeoxyribonuclease RuvC, partial [Rhodothermia bacterium]
MIVLGIDPGSRATGYGAIEIVGSEQRVLAYGVLKLADAAGPAIRLARIHEGLLEILDQTKPDTCAIEMPVYAQNAQSMLKLGRAQAAAMLAAMNRQVPIVEYTPKEIKKSVTGNGNASKEQVWFMVQKILSINENRGLDASDALAISLCHSHRFGTGG